MPPRPGCHAGLPGLRPLRFFNWPWISLGACGPARTWRRVMRVLSAFLLAGLCLADAVACSGPTAPVGRWEGTYESPGHDDRGAAGNGRPMPPSGSARPTRSASRPPTSRARHHPPAAWPMDLATCTGTRSCRARWISTARSSASPAAWRRRSNGIRTPKQMTLIVYLGTKPSIRIPLQAGQGFQRRSLAILILTQRDGLTPT